MKRVSEEPVHEAQLLSYLKLSGCHRGLLINFQRQAAQDGSTAPRQGASRMTSARSACSAVTCHRTCDKQ